ncbi:MAG: hypothetical protein ABL982_02990 [Vicinamibacterales bacterium]
MVWVFARDGRQLRCEVARTDEPASYHLILTQPDRTRTTEEIADPAALVERIAVVTADLRADGWQLA